MGKTIKQHSLHGSASKKGLGSTGKFTGRGDYGFSAASITSRSRGTKINPAPPTRYMIVQINPDLTKPAKQKEIIAKTETARAMFAKYRASK